MAEKAGKPQLTIQGLRHPTIRMALESKHNGRAGGAQVCCRKRALQGAPGTRYTARTPVCVTGSVLRAASPCLPFELQMTDDVAIRRMPFRRSALTEPDYRLFVPVRKLGFPEATSLTQAGSHRRVLSANGAL